MATKKEYLSNGIFNATQLKWIAIVCMIIDHIAWAFVPTDSLSGQLMHTIGRVTAPIMFFFIAEGYHHTKDIKKYLLRLFIFAIASWIPFSLFMQNKIFSPYLGVIFTLFLGLSALCICKSSINNFSKTLAIIGLCFLSIFGDWQIFGVLYVLAFGLNRESFKKQVLWFSIITVAMILTMNAEAFFVPYYNWFSYAFLLGVFIPLPLLYLYNGKRGGDKLPTAFNKWAFYIIYPLHLLVIWLVSQFLF